MLPKKAAESFLAKTKKTHFFIRYLIQETVKYIQFGSYNNAML
jgi:hypothetical protein